MANWYRVGTASITTGTTAVTGTTTAWTNQAKPGDMITLDGGQTFWEIASVDTNTALTLVTAYTETTVTNGAYAIVRMATVWADPTDVSIKLSTFLDAVPADPATLSGLASTATGQGASLIGIEDAGGLIAATNVEAALAENRLAINVVSAVSHRELLTSNRTYYVSTTGSDSNDGLTVGTPLATIQAAINKCYKLDSNGYSVTIQLADGTYHESTIVDRTIVGGARLTIAGNATLPGNVIWYPSTYFALQCLGGSKVRVRDLHMEMDNTWSCLRVGEMSNLYIGNLVFGPALNRSHIEARENSFVTIESNYTITGGAQKHLSFETGATLLSVSKTITVTGTPAFSTAFAVFSETGKYSPYNTTWSGAATGKRYDVTYNAVCRGGVATHFPGDVAGTTATGGQYGY